MPHRHLFADGCVWGTKGILSLVGSGCPGLSVTILLVCHMFTLLMFVCIFDEGWWGTLPFKVGNLADADYDETFNYYKEGWCLSGPKIIWNCYYFEYFQKIVMCIGDFSLRIRLFLFRQPIQAYPRGRIGEYGATHSVCLYCFGPWWN